jgi:exodeoxyribonuclease VII small subunit
MSDAGASLQAGEEPGFEQLLVQLDAIVRELEAGTLGIEASLVRFEEAMGHLKRCYQILERAEQRIEILTSGTQPDQPPELAPFDASATLEANPANRPKPARRRAARDPGAAQPREERGNSEEGDALF